ncbi:MAG: hypothetical protein ABII09_09200 [Planctomycetota bacterium]
MAKKGGNFIEQHIEKLVLITAVLACIYPFYKYVLSSHNVFKLDGREFRPGQLDIHISEQAEQLKQQLNRAPEPRDYSDPCSPVFIAKLDGKWSLDTKITWPVPFSVEQKIDKRYRIPAIGPVKDVAAEHIRAAAYVPKVTVTQENAKNADTYEANDLDLVTVQGSIDIGAIADSFEECFAGRDIHQQWRDTSLAKPVFAAVQLQRQRLDSDGHWGGWQDVPREKIDVQREEFNVIEDVNKLPSGSAAIRRLKFGSQQMQASLLQPEPYQIASMEEIWFPPVLHRKYLSVQREKEAQERREAIATGREEQTGERDRVRSDERDRGRDRGRTDGRTERDSRTRTTREAPGSGIAGRSGEPGSPGGARGGGGTTTRVARPERDQRREPQLSEPLNKAVKPIDDSEIYNELNKMLLTGKDVGALREPVLFWAHDDTVEPGSSYRYRVRVGVFNPVAGTGQVRTEDVSYDKKVMLWSDFSDVTETVSIPRRVYFFPLNVQEAAKAADVQVCRYALGYWYSEQFMIKRGESIGKTAKVTPVGQKQKQEQELMAAQEQEVPLPETVDYTTGAVLVDLIAVNDWAGGKNLQQRQYFNMLYSFDGSDIERIAAKLMYWPDEVRAKYSEIKTLEKRPKVAFRVWNTGGAFGDLTRRGPQMRMPTGRGGEDMRMDEMMRMRQP